MFQMNFFMICIIHKISVLLKLTRILKTIFREYNRVLFFKKTTDTTITDIKNLFRLEKENKSIKERILKVIRNAFRLEKESKAIKDIILRDIRNIFENNEKKEL